MTEKQAQKNTIMPILITGLLAILGTVGGGIIKGYWENQLAHQELNSKLVMKALESTEPSERLATLEFMVQTKLIKDEDMESALSTYIEAYKDKPEGIPQIVGLQAIIPQHRINSYAAIRETITEITPEFNITQCIGGRLLGVTDDLMEQIVLRVKKEALDNGDKDVSEISLSLLISRQADLLRVSCKGTESVGVGVRG